jgi:rhomboid protease GluP
MTPKTPWTTVSVFSTTALLTGLQLVFPALLDALARTPAALSGDWWRFLTPILINRGGAREIAFNLVSLAIVGVLAERCWGPRRWLVFYLVGGLVGQCAGLAWKPYGAGCSVAVCGLLGGLAAWLLLRVRTWQARMGCAVIVVGALALVVVRDLHGPPLLAGAALGAVLLRQRS